MPIPNKSLNKVEDEEPIKCSDLSKGRYWVIGEGKDKEEKGSPPEMIRSDEDGEDNAFVSVFNITTYFKLNKMTILLKTCELITLINTTSQKVSFTSIQDFFLIILVGYLSLNQTPLIFLCYVRKTWMAWLIWLIEWFISLKLEKVTLFISRFLQVVFAEF